MLPPFTNVETGLEKGCGEFRLESCSSQAWDPGAPEGAGLTGPRYQAHLVLGEARAKQGLHCDVEEAAAVGVLSGRVTQVEQQRGVALGQLQELLQAADGLVLGLPVVRGRQRTGRPEGVHLAETGTYMAASPALWGQMPSWLLSVEPPELPVASGICV